MKHFYKPLLLLLTTAVLLLGGCGVQQTASEQEKISQLKTTPFFSCRQKFGPRRKRRLLLQQDFRRLGTTDHQR